MPVAIIATIVVVFLIILYIWRRAHHIDEDTEETVALLYVRCLWNNTALELDLNSAATGLDVAELRVEVSHRCDLPADRLELRQDRAIAYDGSPVVSLGLRGASRYADSDGRLFASCDVKNPHRVTLRDTDPALMVADGCRMCIFALKL